MDQVDLVQRPLGQQPSDTNNLEGIDNISANAENNNSLAPSTMESNQNDLNGQKECSAAQSSSEVERNLGGDKVQNNSAPTTTKPEVAELENLSNVNVAELTTQILDMINQDDTEESLTQTNLLKKNVELQEFMVKLIELLREKTNLSANLERQNTALTNQARSLRDVIAITKDLLNIRNMEVEHLHVDMAAMEKCIKEERERNNMAVQRLQEAMTLNDKLKSEYLNQMELFGKLRDKYNEKVVLLTRENLAMKETLKNKEAVNEQAVSSSQVEANADSAGQ